MVAVVSDLDWQSSVGKKHVQDVRKCRVVKIFTRILQRIFAPLKILDKDFESNKEAEIRSHQEEQCKVARTKLGWPDGLWKRPLHVHSSALNVTSDGCQSATLSDAKATSLFQRDSSGKTWEALWVIEHPPLKIPDSVHGPWFDICPTDQVLSWVFELWFRMLKAVIWSEILKWSTMLPWSTITIARKESVQTLTDRDTQKHKKQR